MDWFGLARELKMSVADARERVSYEEFVRWRAFFMVESERREEMKNR